MKTLMVNIGLMTLMLIAGSCEDEMIYPAPQKRPNPKDPDLYTRVTFPLNSEFISAFSKQTSYWGVSVFEENALELLYWMGLTDGQPVYVLQLEGWGENVMLGKFNIRLSSTWAITDLGGFTYATITSETGSVLEINIRDNNLDLTPEYPYDQMNYEKSFVVLRGEGLLEGCEGKGTLFLSVSDTSPGLMNVRLDGTITLVIARH